MHASDDSPCHSSAKPPPLEGSAPSHGAFQGHAAHLAEWSATLRPKGSSSTCIPEGVSTFFHTAFTAHSEGRAEAGGGQVQALVRQWVASAVWGDAWACEVALTEATGGSQSRQVIVPSLQI